MKKYAFITTLLAMLTAGICQSQTVITADSVSGTWLAGASPYMVTRNIVVPHDATLRIEPGTVIHFTGNYALKVDGKLVAKATKKDPILLEYADSSELARYREVSDTTAAAIEGWKGVRFSKDRSDKDTSVLAYCIIKDAKALTGLGTDCTGGAVSIQGAGHLVIKNCRILNNQAHLGAAIYCHGNNAHIDGNIIENNRSLSNGGAICFVNCRPVLKNNLIRSNTSSEFGGGLYCEKTGGTFVNNTIVENRARFGGAISLVKSNIRLLSNTIANNQAENNGGGIHCWQSGPFIKNTILWGNMAREKGKQIYLFDLGYPDIVYSNIQGGLKAIESFSNTLNQVNHYEANLEDDPVFLNEDSTWYALGRTSPCIDAGLNHDPLVSEGFDMNGHPRIVNNIIDMGAQEFNQAGETEITEIKEDETLQDQELAVNIYPNPNMGRFTVAISGSGGDVAFLGVVNASGQVLYMQSISFEGSALKQYVEHEFNRGFYFVELKDNQGAVLKREKMVIE